MPLRLTIEAKPGRKFPSITVRGGMLVVAVRERAIDGAANAAIERAVAAWLGIGVRAVSIVHGASGRHKQLELQGVDPQTLSERLTSVSERTGDA
jgi:uncharacterized protein YggU (UPF0235/DUF167 family)